MATSIETATQQAIIALVIAAGLVIISTIVLYIWLNSNDKNRSSISIKIDKNGKYHYHIEDNMSNSNLLFWLKIIFYIAMGIMTLLPFHYLMNKG